MKLKNKIIVITGASDGIGRQIVFRLAKERTKLALIARNKRRLSEVSKKAQELGTVGVKIYSCDVCRTDKLEDTVKAIVSDFGKVDILINSAGIWQRLAPIEKIKKDVIDEVIETNLSALIHTTRLFLPLLKGRKEAAIVNVISKSGVVAQEGQSVYTASKYGAAGFTEVLKAELKDSSVRVAAVYQSGTNTKMFKKTGEIFPTEKFTNPADLADVIAYILSLPEKIWLYDIRVEY